MANKSNKCESLKVGAKLSNAKVLDLAKREWVKRFVLPDGSLKKNRWAPIYILRGDEKLSARLDGDDLILSGVIARCPKPAPKQIVWE